MKVKITSLLKKLMIIAIIAVMATSFLVACKEVGDDVDGNGSGQNGANGGNNGNSGSGVITEAGFEDAAYAIVKAVADEISYEDSAIKQSYLDDYKKLCNKADNLLKLTLTDNEDYVAIRDELINKKAKYVSAVLDLKNDELTDDDTESLYELISVFYDTIGKEGFGDFAYELVLYSMEEDYKTADEKSRTLEVELESTAVLQADYETFRDQVSSTEFGKFVNNGILIITLLKQKDDESESESGTFELTDAEIVDMVKKPDFSCNIPDAGWSVVLKKLGGFFSKESYMGMMYEAAKKNADFTKFGSKMKNIVSFIISAQKYTDVNSVNLLRSDMDGYFLSLIEEMNKDEWDNLKALVNIDVNVEYAKRAYDYYNDIEKDTALATAFVTYNDETHPTNTVEDLKTATAANIHDITEGVVASISPAFSYRMFVVED